MKVMTASAQVASFFQPYRTKEFAKESILVFGGDAPVGIFYLLSGTVLQYDVTPQGDKIILNIFKPGSFFPMNWGLDETISPYFLEATDTVKVAIAPRQDVVTFLQAHPEVTMDLLHRLYRGTDGLLERLTSLLGGTAKKRLLVELKIAARRFGVEDPQGIRIPHNERDLAAQTGLARETVNREIQKLKKSGLVHMAGSTITLTSLETLEAELEATD